MRLEQRMGRIHRIGQKHDVYVFNFAADEHGRGRDRRPAAREARGDQGDARRPRLRRHRRAAQAQRRQPRGHAPRGRVQPRRTSTTTSTRSSASIRSDSRSTRRQLASRSQRATSTSHASAARTGARQERRLMPEYVEGFFLSRVGATGLQLERRADGLWRADHVPAALRVRRALVQCEARSARHALPEVHLPQGAARAQSKHLDSELMSPGHPLFAAVDEVLNGKIARSRQGVARFLDPFSPRPYRLHFYDVEVEGGTVAGTYEPATGSSRHRRRGRTEALELGAPDILHDLTPGRRTSRDRARRGRSRSRPEVGHGERAAPDDDEGARRAQREVEIRRSTCEESFEISIRRARERWMRFADQVAQGRRRAEARSATTPSATSRRSKRRRDEKLTALDNIAVVAAGQGRVPRHRHRRTDRGGRPRHAP